MAGECVRVAIVEIEGANPDIDRDLAAADLVYSRECGVWIDIVDRVVIDRPDLLVLDQTDCRGSGHVVSPEENALYDLGRDLGADIVAYYIQGDTAGFRGCAAHPPGRRGFWVGDSATEWTFVHELSHVVGDNRHEDDRNNLMFSNTGRITNPPPDLTRDQCRRITRDPGMGICILQESGRLGFLRVHDLGTGFGGPGDQLDVEVVIKFDHPDSRALGCTLRADREESAHRGILQLLRVAFNDDRPVTVDYRRTGQNSGILLRAALN
jgi:hypothetical protein